MDFKHFWPLIICVCVCVCVGCFSRLQFFVTPWTVCSPPGSSVHGILQARIVEWVALPSSRESSQPRDQTRVSCFAGRFFTTWATRVALQVPPYLGLSFRFCWVVSMIHLQLLWKFFSFSSSFPSILFFTSFTFTCTLKSIPTLPIFRALSCFKAQFMEFLGFSWLYPHPQTCFLFLPVGWKWFPLCWLLFLTSFL